MFRKAFWTQSTGILLGEGGEKRKERKRWEKKRRVSQTARAVPMDPPAEAEGAPALPLYPRSHRRGRGDKGERTEDTEAVMRILFCLTATAPLWVLRPWGYFAIWLTSIALLNWGRPPWQSELLCARSAKGFKMLATSHSNHGKIPGHHFHPRRNVETVQPSEV